MLIFRLNLSSVHARLVRTELYCADSEQFQEITVLPHTVDIPLLFGMHGTWCEGPLSADDHVSLFVCHVSRASSCVAPVASCH